MGKNAFEQRLEDAGLKVRVDREHYNLLLSDDVPHEQAEDQSMYVCIDYEVHHLCDNGEHGVDLDEVIARKTFWVDEDGDGYTTGKGD